MLLDTHGRDQLLERLRDNEGVLREAGELLALAVRAGHATSPAGEWLLDNFYLIEEQIRIARQHLPKGYSWRLPRLGNGPVAGQPRVYELALEAIAHGDGSIDQASLNGFLASYQQHAPLTLGELWAVPIMLRLALIENLRHVVARVAADRSDHDLAGYWAERMAETARTEPTHLILVVADMARARPALSSAFVAEMARQLSGQGAALALPLSWLEQRLSGMGLTVEQLVLAENSQQAADQVSISNSILSIRRLGIIDWRAFVETQSLVERTLRKDPAGLYGDMDFLSRDRCRHVIETLARRAGQDEVAIAQTVLAQAQAAGAPGADTLPCHVGYWLIGRGNPALCTALGLPRRSLRWRNGEVPVNAWLGVIVLVTTALTLAFVQSARQQGTSGALLCWVGLLAAIPCSQFAVAVAHWLAALLTRPQLLPRLDYVRTGVPVDARTLVVVPTLLSSVHGAQKLAEDLEIRFLANRDRHIGFALLTDFPDAPSAGLTGDAAVLEAAVAAIRQLNGKYNGAGDAGFVLLHRPRQWNRAEGVFMGAERKRGKLEALNALLRSARFRGDSATAADAPPTDRMAPFAVIEGPPATLTGVRYVITLDTDTQLPRDAARAMIAAMAHPLNQARPGRRGGVSLLQPRIGSAMPAGGATAFARLFGGETGIDPYTRAVSDVYQDLFGQGSFIGKGIYEVESFERLLGGRFPDNRILSHDLIEGCHAGCALLSDVELFEVEPQTLVVDASRRHRWVRGDWLLLDWLLPKVPDRHGVRSLRNPLSLLSRWKIFDNLRRSLLPVALLTLLLLGWTLLAQALFWTLAVLVIGLLPLLVEGLVELLRKHEHAALGEHLRAALRAFGRRLSQALYQLAVLPAEALLHADAIVRTLWRRYVSRRRLLQWTASHVVEAQARRDFMGTLRNVWAAPVIALGVGAWLYAMASAALPVALPLLLLWLTAPLWVWALDRPATPPQRPLDDAGRRFLRRLAWRTWGWFERFVGPAAQWLPPDNFQQHPLGVIAARTSPTNLGLSLLAQLAAHDFGYLTPGGLLERCAASLDAMALLPRFRGHFYNWYDTRTRQPLAPRYISTVDSGNLAGHLLVLVQGLKALRGRAPLDPPALRRGVADALAVWLEHATLDAGAARALVALLAREDAEPADAAWLRSAVVALAARLPASPQRAIPDLEVGEVEGAVADAAALHLVHLRRLLAEVLRELEAWAPWLTRTEVDPARASLPLPSLAELAAGAPTWRAQHPAAARLDPAWWAALAAQARNRLARIAALCNQALDFAHFEVDFLYDSQRHLFAIGYDADAHRRDQGYYDLLASEARLGIYVAIALGQVPQSSWFALGRSLTRVDSEATLLSWSGSMFEYLMPALVMPSYAGSLLDQTLASAVRAQIRHGARHALAWGVSESGYNATDAALNWQYRAFGVPGLGLKRGLSEDLVIAPYASALALLVDPAAACANLRRLAGEQMLSHFGFFEAVDHTPARRAPGEPPVRIQSYMAHHQGMSLLALVHALEGAPMQRRFCADPRLQSSLLLLQERIPKARGYYADAPEFLDVRTPSATPDTPVRVYRDPDRAMPALQLLSNGRYHLLLSSTGGGYSRWRELALTRWREDGVRDAHGLLCWLKDVPSGSVFCPLFQVQPGASRTLQATFTEARVDFHRHSAHWHVHTQIAVSPEDDIELRRMEIRNLDSVPRTVELTSYAEVVLAPQAADAIHPAFSNLFVQTEQVPGLPALLCTRRPRAASEQPPWLLHALALHGTPAETLSVETDRLQFLGRGRGTDDPQAFDVAGPLSGSTGAVLDPIVAIRVRLTVPPGERVCLDWVLGAHEQRAGALALVDKYRDPRMSDRVFELAWTHSHVALRQLNLTEAEAQLFGRLAASVVYADPGLRARSELIRANRRDQSGLWGHSISGDLPIVLVQVRQAARLELVRQLLLAHAYWRQRGLAADLVIVNEEQGGYRQELSERIAGLIGARLESQVGGTPGGVFVRAAEQMSAEDRILLQAVARVVLIDGAGALAEQLAARARTAPVMPPLLLKSMPVPVPDAATVPAGTPTPPVTSGSGLALLLDNGFGGFSADGREYLIRSGRGRRTPAPWCNVIANPQFGCVISESGGGYTFKDNAQQFRLTPWHNDPVSDQSGEAFYLRDEDSGRFWSPTPLPAPGPAQYLSRHGFGYSVFSCTHEGLASELWVYVDPAAPVKFFVLRLRNQSGRARQLSFTGYLEWVLGEQRARSAQHIVTELDPETGALLARNAFHGDFAHQIAFLDVDDAARTLTGDRREFLGRHGTLAAPAALHRAHLSGRVGAGMDPCGAIQVPFGIEDGGRRQLIFRLGVGDSAPGATALIKRFRQHGAARAAFGAVGAHWQRTLGQVQVRTPDPALDLLANGWLLYQTLACRLWARSGYYQSGGAFGFRDQLQDAMALVHTRPELLRAQLLLAAGRQFVEGDVQHWWHPPAGRGVRTACSDDLLWLPLAAARYVECSGDDAVLDEEIGYLGGRELPPGEDSCYDLPHAAHERGTLYQHCQRSIRRVGFGSHGLPLMGGGDWNDGMNRVGIEGRGESVWLGFFLHALLGPFAQLARRRGDLDFALECEGRRAALAVQLELHAWDGDWYRRAWFDDGTPLGSAANPECQIDSLAQSWAVLSGVGSSTRVTRALDALDARLVREQEGQLIQLLDPPFDDWQDPGYIRGYVPGVRENGGQYTHAAIWAVMAFAAAGRGERAWQLFDLINPLRHGNTRDKALRYRVEPYVVSADVYARAPHSGRGGWSWYTGSASWMYRLILESLLGVRRIGATLELAPVLPAAWPSFAVDYRFGDALWQIVVTRVDAAADAGLTVDGRRQTGSSIALRDDRATHQVELRVI